MNTAAQAREWAADQTIEELAKTLATWSSAYYNGEEIVSDAVFDAVRDMLRVRAPTHPYLREIGAPVVAKKKEVRLRYPMGSLETKAKNQADLDKWMAHFRGPYVVSSKIDGMSALFVKEKGVTLSRRGDGVNGFDVTKLVPILFKKTFLTKLPEGIAARGELVISRANFETIRGEMKNARNAMAGILTSETLDADWNRYARLVDFVVYELPSEAHLTLSEQLKMAKSLGFTVVDHEKVKKPTEETLKAKFDSIRVTSPYEVDGVVLRDDHVYPHTEGTPDYAIAWKSLQDDQVAIVTVVRVEWNVSKDRYLKPRIEIEPVDLVGATITHATGFNAKFIEENSIGPGTVLKIVRSGDVIPHIIEVIKSTTAQMPDERWEWNAREVDAIAIGSNEQVIVKQLTHFAQTIGAENVSEATFAKLVENGMTTLPEILDANRARIAEIPGLGEKTAERIQTSIIAALEKCTLTSLMDASGAFGRGVGTRRLDMIVEHLDLMKKPSETDLVSIPGVGPVFAKQIATHYDDWVAFFKSIQKYGNLSRFGKKLAKKAVGNALEGRVFVFTGFRDAALEAKILDAGGKVTGSVSGKTTDLVVKDASAPKTGKVRDAEAAGVRILDLTAFKASL